MMVWKMYLLKPKTMGIYSLNISGGKVVINFIIKQHTRPHPALLRKPEDQQFLHLHALLLKAPGAEHHPDHMSSDGNSAVLLQLFVEEYTPEI